MTQTYEQWLKELPDWLDANREKKDSEITVHFRERECDFEGGLMMSKKVLDQTLEILRAITDGDVTENLKREFGGPRKQKRKK